MPNRIERSAASLRDSLIVLQSRSFPADQFPLFMEVARVQFDVDELCKEMARAFAGLLTPPDNDRAAEELNEAAGLASTAHPDQPETVKRAVREADEACRIAREFLQSLTAPGVA